MKIVLSGATGFLGDGLIASCLGVKDSVAVLTRFPDRVKAKYRDAVTPVPWDGRNAGPWHGHIDGADAVINLAGDSIGAGRWTATRKQTILASRVDATRAIVKAIERAGRKPSVLINGSAVGYYGAVEEGEVTEQRRSGSGFLAGVCAQWEATALAAEAFGVRVVPLRMGVVLARGGGALQRMLLPFRFFVGGPLGSGRQWFPWIHRDDVVAIVRFVLERTDVRGPINVVAPDLVRMSRFCRAVGAVMRRPSWMPVPGVILRLALGEMSIMLLTGQPVVPERLKHFGYAFKFPELDEALRDALQ